MRDLNSIVAANAATEPNPDALRVTEVNLDEEGIWYAVETADGHQLDVYPEREEAESQVALWRVPDATFWANHGGSR